MSRRLFVPLPRAACAFLFFSVACTVAPPIVGTWERVGGDTSVTLEFLPDGNVTSVVGDEQLVGKYEFLEGDRIKIDYGARASAMIFTLKLEKDGLSLTEPNGSTSWFTKAESPPEPLKSASKSARAAVGALRAIASAQLAYRESCGEGFFASDIESLTNPIKGSKWLSLGKQHADDYRLILKATSDPSSPESCSGLPNGRGARSFAATAVPLGHTQGTNAPWFAIDSDGRLFWAESPFVMPESGAPGPPARALER